jgi:hypothetical protein
MINVVNHTEQAATKNADVMATAYNQLIKQGIPKDQAPQLICFGDASSKERPCIPQTAMGTLAAAPR